MKDCMDNNFDLSVLSEDDIAYITGRMEKECPEQLRKISKKFDFIFKYKKKRGQDNAQKRRR